MYTLIHVKRLLKFFISEASNPTPINLTLPSHRPLFDFA
jgi:hypothetical protein